MKNVVFWDTEAQFVPQETHYVSARDLSQLMLCKIEVFAAVTEECRPLGCKAAWLL
jgi:hypothetical protein